MSNPNHTRRKQAEVDDLTAQVGHIHRPNTQRQKHLARLATAHHAKNPDDLRTLLHMLGLVEEEQ